MVCMHGGQGCAITTRLLLPRSRYDEGVEIARRRRSRAGRTATRPTPRTCRARSINARAARAGARPHRAGQGRGRARASSAAGRPTQFDKGYFVAADAVRRRRPRLRRIAQEEIFGPVLAVIPYDDDDDAVRIANNSRYGLSGAVNGGDLDRALGVAAADPHRHRLGQRRPVVRPRLAVRRLQAERHRPRARRRRLRGVPRDQDHRSPRRLSPAPPTGGGVGGARVVNVRPRTASPAKSGPPRSSAGPSRCRCTGRDEGHVP